MLPVRRLHYAAKLSPNICPVVLVLARLRGQKVDLPHALTFLSLWHFINVSPKQHAGLRNKKGGNKS